MKNRFIGLILLILIVILGVFMLYRTQQKIEQKKAIQENIQSLPDFTFYHLEDSTQFIPKDLLETQSTLLIYFNSECEHCQYEASEIYKQQAQFRDTQILMVSSENIAAIQGFAKKYQLGQIPFLKVLKVNTQAFYDNFGSLSVPSIFIYDANQRLVKAFKGEVKIEKLLEYTNKEK